MLPRKRELHINPFFLLFHCFSILFPFDFHFELFYCKYCTTGSLNMLLMYFFPPVILKTCSCSDWQQAAVGAFLNAVKGDLSDGTTRWQANIGEKSDEHL